MKDCLDLGLYIGITGLLCDERRGKELQDAVNYLPLDRIMLETDSRFLLPRTITPKPKSNAMNTKRFLTSTVFSRIERLKCCFSEREFGFSPASTSIRYLPLMG